MQAGSGSRLETVYVGEVQELPKLLPRWFWADCNDIVELVVECT